MPCRIRRSTAAAAGVSLRDALLAADLDPRLVTLLEEMPHKKVSVDPRRPFREPGVPRDEVIFVRSGILCKYKTDGSGRRQIVALRFQGEGILPHEGLADYGVQGIVRSEVLVGKAADLDRIVDAHPELCRFFWRLIQRNKSISYEWLVNCGRRNSTARVAHFLCETATRSGIRGENGRMTNPFTQQQIADITGQTSVNVNRVFADLQRQGLIARKGREIEFRDWAEMRRWRASNPITWGNCRLGLAPGFLSPLCHGTSFGRSFWLLNRKSSDGVGPPTRGTRMNQKFTCAAALLAAVSLPTAAEARTQMRAVGSSTVYPFAKAVAERVARANPRLGTPIIEWTGTGAGMKLFCAGVGERFPDMEVRRAG